MARLSLLSTSLACLLALQGCIATHVSTPQGLSLTRISIGSDVDVRAKRNADGSVSVDETQGQVSAQAVLDLLTKALAR